VTNTSEGKGDAYDAQVLAVDNVGGTSEIQALHALASEAATALETAIAKVTRQREHLKAAEASVATAKTELTRAQKALAKAEREA
jgi:multidrug resistance efflux pump